MAISSQCRCFFPLITNNFLKGKGAEKLDMILLLPIKGVGGATMDIAALSISMSQAQLMQNVSLAVVNQAMEVQQQNTEQLVDMMDAPHPTLGNVIDIQI